MKNSKLLLYILIFIIGFILISIEYNSDTFYIKELGYIFIILGTYSSGTLLKKII